MVSSHFSGCRSSRRGTIVVWLLLAMAPILGIVALGMDGGRMMDARRQAQTAADAAALAAAADLYEHYWTQFGKDPFQTAQAAAIKSAAANGFANDGTDSTVTVNEPPCAGTMAGKPGYVEVIVSSRVSAGFSRIFTREDLPVQARAVALGQPMKLGLILLRPTGSDAFLNKAFAFTVVNSPIIVNSNDPVAFDQAGFGAVIASRYDITGGYVNSGGLLMGGRIRTGVRPTPDPLLFLQVPDSSGVPIRSTQPLTIDAPLPTILQPGVYQGGIKLAGAASVVMTPGVYIMDGGGFQVNDQASVAGLEVMIYNTAGSYPAGPIVVDSLGKVVLAAPLSGMYQGINFFQNRALAVPLAFSGHGVTAITGVVYAVSARVNVTETVSVGVEILGGAYVCDSIQISGIGSIGVNLGLNPPRVPDVHLVE